MKKEKLPLSCVTRVESVLILPCTTTNNEEISRMSKLSRNQWLPIFSVQRSYVHTVCSGKILLNTPITP